jgi:hypothetical protein
MGGGCKPNGSRASARCLCVCAAAALAVVGCGDDATTGERAADAASDAHTAMSPDAASSLDAAAPALDASADTDAARDAASADADAALDAALDASGDPDSDGGGDPAGVVVPMSLAETGLYRAGSTVDLADGVIEYAPSYVLWSDGAEKRRWLFLPPGTAIDTSAMDDWQFPVGTKAWKQFTRDGKKIETRLLWKTEAGWFMRAFAWDDTETEALAAPNGVVDARGTDHDIPESGACRTCHEGSADTLLGVSAIQLSHDGPGLTLQALAAAGSLSDAPASGDYRLPAGDDWAVLGYLHANCGTCHNPNGVAFDRAEGLQLWLTVDSVAGAIDATPSYTSTVGVPLSDAIAGYGVRVAAGSSAQSALVYRMEVTRGDDLAMPPLATELVDMDNVNRVKAWIDGL